MYAFVHIGKTAGSNLTALLRRSFGLAHCDVEPWRGYRALPFGARDWRWVERLHPPLKSIAGHTVTPWSDLETVVPDVRYYTFLREPLARTASHYQYHEQQMGKDRSFEAFMAIPRQRNFQCRMIAGEPSAQAAIEMVERKEMFVGLVEAFDRSLRMLSSWMDGALLVDYEVRNAAPSQSIAARLREDPVAMALMEEANQEDLAFHGWAKDVWMKRQRERIGEVAPESFGPPGMASRLSAPLARVHRNVVYKPLLRLAQRLSR